MALAQQQHVQEESMQRIEVVQQPSQRLIMSPVEEESEAAAYDLMQSGQ